MSNNKQTAVQQFWEQLEEKSWETCKYESVFALKNQAKAKTRKR
jgi:hypothetical protein